MKLNVQNAAHCQGEHKTFEINRNQDFRQWLKANKIEYKYFKY